MNSNRILRLKKLLLAHLERLQNNMIALERDINKAAGRHAIHRRKLKDFLRTSKDVSLRLSELEAFDDYLSEHGEGLAFVPIFERPALLPTLAAQKVVHFLVGARSIKKILNVSHLDTDAFGAIGQALNNPRPVASVLEVVLLDAPQRERDLLIERTLQTAEGVVVIGSPVSNPAAERMLQLMTGYRASKFGGATRPPLALVLPDQKASKDRSSFVETPGQQTAENASYARTIRNFSWGLRVGRRLLVSEEEEMKTAKGLSRTYGVIVAQRRANGHIWVVVAGLHGAGTLAAARALDSAEISLGSGPAGVDGPVHVRVVEALVSSTRLRGTVIAKVESQRLLPEFSDTSFPPPGGDGPALAKVALTPVPPPPAPAAPAAGAATGDSLRRNRR